MKLKFKKQEFQEKAVNAVADLFKGQEKAGSTFSIADNSAQMALLQNDFGFGNKLLLDKETLASNLKNIQKGQALPQMDFITTPPLQGTPPQEGNTPLRDEERLKIHCGAGHFKALDDIHFSEQPVTDWKQFKQMV